MLGLPFTNLVPMLLASTFAMQVSASTPTTEGKLRLVVTQQNPAPHLGPKNSYGLAIANMTDHSVAIQRKILIEKHTPSGWKQQGALQAISTCDEFDDRWSSNSPVRLEPHAIMTVVPSDGWLCGEQCPTPCMQNAPHVPGIYRFVVLMISSGERLESPQFRIEWLEMYVRERAELHQLSNRNAKLYSLVIDNMSDRTIYIKRGISIWKKTPTGWSQQPGVIQAISRCDQFDHQNRLEAPIQLPSFGTIAAVPWDGLICGGQCPTACTRNFPLGPGTFRFEIAVMPDGTKLQGPEFTMR